MAVARFGGAVGELAGAHAAAVREAEELRAELGEARGARAAAEAEAGARLRAEVEKVRDLGEECARLRGELVQERLRVQALTQDLAQSKGDHGTLAERQQVELEREKAWRINLEGELRLKQDDNRVLREKLSGQVALTAACEGQLKLSGEALRDTGRHLKSAEATHAELKQKHAEHLRLRDEWVAEAARSRQSKKRLGVDLQECLARETAARQAVLEAAATLEEEAAIGSALKVQVEALRQELAAVETRYFSLAEELKVQSTELHRAKRACLEKYGHTARQTGDGDRPHSPNTPQEPRLPGSPVTVGAEAPRSSGQPYHPVPSKSTDAPQGSLLEAAQPVASEEACVEATSPKPSSGSPTQSKLDSPEELIVLAVP